MFNPFFFVSIHFLRHYVFGIFNHFHSNTIFVVFFISQSISVLEKLREIEKEVINLNVTIKRFLWTVDLFFSAQISIKFWALGSYIFVLLSDHHFTFPHYFLSFQGVQIHLYLSAFQGLKILNLGLGTIGRNTLEKG